MAPPDGRAREPGAPGRAAPLEPGRHTLLQRAVDPNVGHAVEPQEGPCVEVVIGEELPAVEEVVADVVDRPLDLALRLGPVRTARADPEAPMAAEAQELRVLDQPATLVALVVGDDGLHLVEQELRRHAAEVGERRFQPPHHDRHRLALVEPEPHPPRVAQHHDQRVPLAPRQPEVREVHLALVAGRSLEPPDRLHRLLRPDPAHVALHLAVAARIARRLHLVEQPHGAQLRVLGQARVNDPLVGIELRRPPRPGSVPDRLAVRASV